MLWFAGVLALLALGVPAAQGATVKGVVTARVSSNSVVVAMHSGALVRVRCPRRPIAVGRKITATGAYNALGVFIAAKAKAGKRVATTTLRAVTIGSDGGYDLVGGNGVAVRVLVPAHRSPAVRVTMKVKLGSTLHATTVRSGAVAKTVRISGVFAAAGSGVLALRLAGGTDIGIRTNHVDVSYLKAGDAIIVDLRSVQTASGTQFALLRYAVLAGAYRLTTAKKPEYSGMLKSITASAIVLQPLVGNPTTLRLPHGIATNGARVNDTVFADAHMSGATIVADHVIVLTKFVPTSPPSVSFVATPPSATPATTAVFEWSTIGVVDTVQCSLDGVGGWTNCNNAANTKTITGIKPGGHTFSVLAGNVKGYAPILTYSWTIQVPANPISVTITSAPAATTYSTSASFSFTTAGTVTSLQCSHDGTAWQTCTSPVNLTGLALGSHVFGVLAGNASGWNTATAHWTVQPVPAKPTATFTSKPADGPATNVSFAWTTAGIVDTTTCSIDAGAFAACTSPDSRTVSSTPGAHTFAVKVTNAGGSNTATATWNVTAPTGPTVAITLAPPDGTSTSAAVNYTITNPAPGGTAPTLTCTLDGAATTPCTQPTNAASVPGTWSKSGLALGGHTFTLSVSDGTHPAGTASVSWTIGGTVTITSAPTGSTSSTSASIAFTTTGGASATCKLDSATAAACTSPVTYTGLAVGSHTVTVTASNGGSAAVTWTVTSAAPTVTLTSTPPSTTPTNYATFIWSTTGNVTNTDCQIDGGAFTACTSGVTYTSLSVAAHSFVVRVTNTAMPAPNTGTATYNWTVSNAPPPPPAPGNTGLPTFTPAGWTPRSGTKGTTGTASTGTWSNSPTGYAYQWYRCTSTAATTCSAIAGATTASYHAVSADIDLYLRVAVTASNAGGSTQALSNSTPMTQPS